ncbi:PASTA domain-containing protein [Rhodococcus sp. ARC_M5]|uniref:PASTA domain-containing protein n=1 Tax=Rhodococcus sp. ARC_M5 TaxID=2928851 RepID=UPI0035B07F6B
MVASGCSASETEPPSVPDVTGLWLDDAHDTLDAAGFEEFEDRDALGERVPWVDSNWAVVRQEPAADRSLRQSDSVILYVGKPEDAGMRELLPASSPVLAEIDERDQRDQSNASTAQSTSATAAPAPPEEPTFRYSGKPDDAGPPALPPVPDLVPRLPGTARVEVSGAWSGTWESTSVNCAAYRPGESTFRGWEYVAGPSVGGKSALGIKLHSKYADGADEGRLRFDPDVSAAFRDEDSRTIVWEANGSGVDQPGGDYVPQAVVEVSPDRSTVSFGAVGVAHSSSFFADYNQVGWVTITGTLTCAEAPPEVGE